MSSSVARKAWENGIERLVDLPSPAGVVLDGLRKSSDNQTVAVREVSPKENNLEDHQQPAAMMYDSSIHKRKVGMGNEISNSDCSVSMMEFERKTLLNRSPDSKQVSETEYRPVACSVYDLFEAAALRRRPLMLTIAGKTGEYAIHDVFSKGQEEFLLISPVTGSQTVAIRLDKIELVVDPTDKKSYFPYDC